MMLRLGETLDSIIYHDLFIIQKEKGYRFNLDTLFLFGFINEAPSSPALDLGCGSGVISFLLARRWDHLRVVGLEIQPGLAEMARRSALINGLDSRVAIVRGDIKGCRLIFRPGSFGSVICNPPYRKPGTGRLPPNPERAAARHEILMSLNDLLSSIDYLLSHGGTFTLSWKPERLKELLDGLQRYNLCITHIRHVSSRAGSEPFLLLCRGCRTTAESVTPIKLPALIVHEGSSYSEEVSKLLKNGVFPSY